MGDYTESKGALGDLSPAGAVESTWSRLEPLLTANQLVTRHLFGISLYSSTINPLTKKAANIGPDELNDHIVRAVSMAEKLTGIIIFPTTIKERTAFDASEFDSFGYIRVNKRPLASVERIAAAMPNGNEIMVIPKDWIDNGQFAHGQINIFPLTPGVISADINTGFFGHGSRPLLSILGGGQRWIPSFWTVSYTAGFPDAKIPRSVNELVGVLAAMEILSALANTNAKNTSSSLSIDSMSQSMSGPGQDLNKTRMGELAEKRDLLINAIKSEFNLKIFSNNI